MKKGIVLFIFLTSIHILLHAQESEDIYDEILMERIAEKSEVPVDPDERYDPREDVISGVNLNRCTEEELSAIPFLSATQIKNLVDYRREYGQLLSVYELKHIRGFDMETIRKIIPYFRVESYTEIPPPTPANLIRKSRSTLVLRYRQVLQRQEGFTDNSYLGSPQGYYLRYTYSWQGRISAGISGDKSPGEQFLGGAQSSGFDYYSSYLAVHDFHRLKVALVGSFTAAFGQGLTLGTSFSGATPGFGSPFSYRQGVRPSLSTYSAGNLKGFATTLSFKRVRVTGFYSSRKRDGSVTDSTVGSLSLSGLHRTETEIRKRSTVLEHMAGGNISFSGGFFRAGVTGYHAWWDHTINTDLKPYSYFDFRGKESTNIGMDYLVRIRNTALFGEISKSIGGDFAWLCGISAEPASGIRFSVVIRDYGEGYRNLFTNAIGQTSKNSNEEGILLQLSCNPFRNINISSYADIYRFSWLKYRVNAPTRGSEAGCMVLWNISEKASLSARYILNHTEANDATAVAKVQPVESGEVTSIRIGTTWSPYNFLNLKTTFEIKSSTHLIKNKATGSMASQDLRLNLFSRKIAVILKYILFDVPDYSLRIYYYEPDVLYSMSIPALEGRGYRVGVMLRMDIKRKCTMWFRYGMVHYFDRTVIGTGTEAIEGNNKSDVTLQLRITL